MRQTSPCCQRSRAQGDRSAPGRVGEAYSVGLAALCQVCALLAANVPD